NSCQSCHHSLPCCPCYGSLSIHATSACPTFCRPGLQYASSIFMLHRTFNAIDRILLALQHYQDCSSKLTDEGYTDSHLMQYVSVAELKEAGLKNGEVASLKYAVARW